MSKREAVPKHSLPPQKQILSYMGRFINCPYAPDTDRDRFFAVMERCDGEIMLQTAYTEGALERQREYLLQNSEYRLFAE